MDKENGKSSENNSGSNKSSNGQDPSSILDAASLFGAYWPRDAGAASLFAAAAAAGGFGLQPHPAAATQLSYGGGGGGAGGRGGGASAAAAAAAGAGYPPLPTSSSAASYGAAAYTNTLSVAASQAASLGMPAASAAWWSMASHLAAQDYLARLQASGLSFPGLGGPASAVDPYLGLLASAGGGRSASHPKPKARGGPRGGASKEGGTRGGGHSKAQQAKYAAGLTIQPAKGGGDKGGGGRGKQAAAASIGGTDLSSVAVYASNKSSVEKQHRSGNGAKPSPPPSSVFTSPLSLGSSGSEKGSITTNVQNSVNNVTSLPSSILSDPSSILGGVRLPPDTEIIKYTSSIVGPRVPGTTNRGRKKTISLDPPSVTVHPAHASLAHSVAAAAERLAKRQKITEELTPPSTPTATSSSDRVEVIKLPATNGSPSSSSSYGGMPDSAGEAPLNLSLKPSTATGVTSSLNSLSNMSASIGVDRISRRKPGPKPRRVIQSSQSPPPSSPFFGAADSPQRPPSRSEGSDGGSSTSSTSAAMPSITPTSLPIHNHKEGRPRNLGRGVSKPKKNTVASLLAQSRALGIKPMPVLDPNVSMNQQMNMLRSNILAAQQYIQEAGGDEKALNKFLQDKFKSAQSDSSTVDASDSDNLTDSNHTDSEMEAEVMAKKQKQYDERLLRVPLEKGWKRETIIRGLTKNGGIKGDVTYSSPDSSNKFKQMSDVTQYLDYQKNIELSRDNFTFSCRVILGDYLQPVPPEMMTDGNEFIHLSEEDVTRRLEELKAAMRTSLPVEQRIELARKQQAARAAARLDREQQRLTKELERSERQEAARREKELKTQQMLEAKRKRQEEMEKQKHEEQQRKQQERELKRQHAALLKEQIYIQEMSKQREMLYTVELERERRRQHMALVKAMESRRKLEERERKKQQLLAEKQANKEKKMEQRKVEMEILSEIRKPCEDLELEDQKPLPEYERIPGLKLSGKAFGDILMTFEFLHTFGETLGFDMESLPTLDSLQQAMMPNEHTLDAEEELFSVMTHLLVCAIEDPGIPNPARYTTILGQSLRQADITHANLSEILRIYLYANATGEVKALTGVHFERDREKRIADHHQNDLEMLQTQSGKNSQYYELLHENQTYKMSDMLKDKPFMALNPTDKAAILAFICNELLQNKAVIRQIESSLESVAHQKKEKWLLDNKIRKVKALHSRKSRAEAIEKSHNKTDPEDSVVDSPSLHKDDLLDYEENEMSENESVGTQPEEDEDNKASAEELSKKLEKLLKTSETQQQALNTSSLQLRATCFGEDRYFRRYWSLSKSGGIFVEAMESAEPEEIENQILCDQNESVKNGIKNLNELSAVVDSVEKINDSSVDKEVSSIVGDKISEHSDFSNVDFIFDNDNEHRKTPNRLEIVENGEITEKTDMDTSARNLAELQKSVDDIVQNLERNIELEKEQKIKEESQQNCINNSIKSEDEPIGNKKFNLFEKLGQCMERENNSGEDLKAEVKAEIKEELKNEILNELKSEIKTEPKIETEENESKWFSILHKDNATCDEVHLTAGNKWDNGNVGACTKEITELKIPVFPPPGCNSVTNYHNNCDSPAPIQMTNEENAQLEHIKKYGMPKSCIKKSVPLDKRFGWWRIFSPEQLKEVLTSLHVRGARERELKRGFVNVMQQMYERQGKLVIEEGTKDLIELNPDNVDEVTYTHGSAPMPDEPGSWSLAISHRAEMFLLEQVEALEDKVASASMQVKGWKIPNRDTSEELPHGDVLSIVRERLTSLELNIERRYLKPPLGVNIGDPNLAAIAQEACGSTLPAPPIPGPDEVPKGLAVWREAINRAHTSAQLAMCLYGLEASIAWDKSIMKANCQFCHSGDNEDKLLLCDSCDRGYHTYCFKPKMDNIPEGDWYCHECMNKATGERNCIVCGKKPSLTGTRLVVCELCPRAYHTDCIQPQMHKVPRGKWYCTNCISKKPQKKIKKPKLEPGKERHSESSDQPPPSPAPSHSSVTTNEDQPPVNCNQSDVSNSSLVNVGSPSSSQQPCSSQIKKDRPNKKLIKELAPCKAILDDLECHDDAWPFLLPVNTKQFPTYKKIIKIPMDLSTIKKRLQDLYYKSRDEFCVDVRQIFNNCEIFNEDDSPVGKAGHCMRLFFEARWNELCSLHS